MIFIMSLIILWLVYWLYKADKEIIHWKDKYQKIKCEYEILLLKNKHNNLDIQKQFEKIYNDEENL